MPQSHRLLVGRARLRQGQQRHVSIPEAAEVRRQQERVPYPAGPLGPPAGERQRLLVLAHLLKPQAERPQAHRFHTFGQPPGDGLRLTSDRHTFLRPAPEHPDVREEDETLDLQGLCARPPRG